MTNRTASVNHASLSDKAHEARRVEPTKKTMELIYQIRLDNAKRAHRQHEAQRMEAAVVRLTARVASL